MKILFQKALDVIYKIKAIKINLALLILINTTTIVQYLYEKGTNIEQTPL